VTRARILDAARDMFAEKGYEKVSLREIAEVWHHQGRLYYYFPTKESIFESLMKPFFEMHQVVFELLETPPNMESWRRLISFLDWILTQRNCSSWCRAIRHLTG